MLALIEIAHFGNQQCSVSQLSIGEGDRGQEETVLRQTLTFYAGQYKQWKRETKHDVKLSRSCASNQFCWYLVIFITTCAEHESVEMHVWLTSLLSTKIHETEFMRERFQTCANNAP